MLESIMEPTSTFTVVALTTVAADHDALALGRLLVSEGLAACVNVLPPMQSVYQWHGTIQEDAERQLVIKTRVERLEALEARLRELHPYEVPEFVVLPVVDGSTAYLDWVRASVGIPPGADLIPVD
jgi:periplasmic divalent cation tolerance protein